MIRSLYLPLFLAAGCGGGPTCVQNLATDCAPLYEPTFANIHQRTMTSICAASPACHGGDNPQKGLDLREPDRAYQLLTDAARGPLVKAADAACSPLIERLESSEPSFQMPPGSQLPEAARCVFRRWIQAGAAR